MPNDCRLRVELTRDRVALLRVLVEVFGRGMDVEAVSFGAAGDEQTMHLSLDTGPIAASRAITLIERLVPVRSVTPISGDLRASNRAGEATRLTDVPT